MSESADVTAASSTDKPQRRARLGETQIVELSDDDDEPDLVGRDDDDTAGDASGPDFLKDYPDTTDVSNLYYGVSTGRMTADRIRH